MNNPTQNQTREAWPRVDARDERTGVLLLTSSLERGGAERQVVELANSLDAKTFRVHVCSLSTEVPLASALRDADERLIVLPKQNKYDFMLVVRVARLLRHLRASVVHSFMFDAEMVGRIAGRLARTPAVICSNRCPHLLRAAHKLWLARVTRGCFDMMVANSRAGYEFERDNQRVTEAKLCVIPNGVDTVKFHPGDGTAMRRELGIASDALVVGMFAHFRGNKDHTTFIEAAAKVVRAQPNAVFLCVGQPDGEEETHHYGKAKRLVEQLNLRENVRFLGARSDVDALYRVLDIKVLSTFFEGTPNVVLEAMASGLPVIATNVSDNARIIIEDHTGFIVPPSDATTLADRILRLLQDEALRQRFGAAARRRAEQEFSIAALGRRTADVYLDVLRRKGKLNMPATSTVLAGGKA